MATDYKRKLVDYIRKNLSKGYTIDSLRWALVKQGYTKSIVEDAIRRANEELAARAPRLDVKPIIIHEIIDEYDKPIVVKKPWWKKILGK